MRYFRYVARLCDPRHLWQRCRFALRNAGEAPAIYFVAHNRNHVRLMADAARMLGEQGHTVEFVQVDEAQSGGVARPELERLGFTFIGFDQLRSEIRPRDILVTANDFGTWQPYKRFLDSINRGLVTVIGMIEGARALRRHRYERVDHVLALGPVARDHFTKPVYVVGSPVVEALLRKTGGGAGEGRFVLINFKGDPDDNDDRASLDAAIAACDEIGVPCKVSVHPNIAERIANSSSVDFAELLPNALALVTRPSTTAYEAMACGIPVVIFPEVRPLVEFGSPLGAFSVSRSASELVGHLKEAIASRPGYKARSAAFLARHLSIEPGLDASTRIARAIAEIGQLRQVG